MTTGLSLFAIRLLAVLSEQTRVNVDVNLFCGLGRTITYTIRLLESDVIKDDHIDSKSGFTKTGFKGNLTGEEDGDGREWNLTRDKEYEFIIEIYHDCTNDRGPIACTLPLGPCHVDSEVCNYKIDEDMFKDIRTVNQPGVKWYCG